jgi:DNA (cytosine-5)-methyltransferase 1
VRYLSVCSGIEAASVAWEPLGWAPVAFAEIEKFPSKVLAHHYPGVPNLGDMTKFREWDIERGAVDVLVGGTPCQSFSVAGLRKGLDDPRGNLALTFVAMVDHYRPEWVIWENVPGVLSSSGGRDFGSFLGALGQLGYGFAYRVLDAQYFGVPQRRRRVFVVAHSSGDSRRAAEVLFEPESLRWDSPKGNRKGEKSTSSPTSSTDANGIQRTVGTLCADTHPGAYSGQDAYTGRLVPVMYQNNQTDARLKEETRTSQTVLARWGTGGGNTPLVHHVESFAQNQLGELRTSPIASTLGTNSNASGRNTPMVIQPIAIAENTIGRQPMNGGNGDGYTVGGPMYTLNATGVHAVAHPAHAFKIRGGCEGGGKGYLGTDEKVFTLSTTQDQWIAQAFNHQSGGDMRGIDLREYPQLQAHQQTSVLHDMAVRRLTPTECERIQGFPDGYTDIMPETPDGPRYKALGNSMAVPVMRWIGSRIALATK